MRSCRTDSNHHNANIQHTGLTQAQVYTTVLAIVMLCVTILQALRYQHDHVT